VDELVPAGWDLVSAICSDESPIDAIDLAAGETVTCTFINEREDDYDGPGDGGGFDSPFDDAGDPGAPAPTAPGGTAGTNDQTGTQSPAAPAPQPAIENNTPARPDEPTGPVALDQLPRTGQGLDRATVFGGLLLMLGGLTVIFGQRRRAHKA
jgi:LPXTG-motif cell wall-anchored protein